jgi:hypothetical protein
MRCLKEGEMSKEHKLTTLAGLAGETIEAVAAGQAVGLALLKGEMEALVSVLPGHPHETPAETAARLQAEDAQTESDFDNMPV